MPSQSRTLSRSRNEPAQIIETVIVIPPDGGWGWAIVIAAFITNMITDGSLYTFGIFLDDIALAFNVPKTRVAIVSSVLAGFYFLSGPFACALTNSVGFRVVGLAGGFSAALSIFLTSQWTVLWPIFITHGICCGVAFGMVYVPSILVIGFYFERWRALANSIASTGSSVGIIAFPPVIKIILGGFTWRFQFCILSGMFIIVGLCALIYRPLKAFRVEPPLENISAAGSKMTPLEIESQNSKFSKITSYHNKAYPTAAEYYREINVLKEFSQETIGGSVSVLNSNEIGSHFTLCSAFTKTSRGILGCFRSIPEEETQTGCCSCLKNCKSGCCCYCCSGHGEPVARPMYRDDILYGASLNKLPEYTSAVMRPSNVTTNLSTRAVLDYHLSVTRVAVTQTKRPFCPVPIKRTLVTMLDMKILKYRPFMFLALSGFFTTLGLYVPFVYIVDRTLQNGYSSNKAYFLLSLMGVANAVGRMLIGIIASLPHFNALLATWLTVFSGGVAAIISSLWKVYEWQIGFVCVYGSSVACFSVIRIIVIVDLVKLENLTTALGVSLVFQGVAAFISMPIVEVIVKAMNDNYDAAFYFGGGAVTFSALLLIPIGLEQKKLPNTSV